MLTHYLVLAKRNLGVDFVGEVERDLNSDEERGAAEDECRNAREPLDDGRHDRDETEEGGAGERDAIHHFTDVLFRLAARTHAGDKGSRLLQILRDPVGLEGDGGIEIGEENDEQEVHRAVVPRIREKSGVPKLCRRGEGNMHR